MTAATSVLLPLPRVMLFRGCKSQGSAAKSNRSNPTVAVTQQVQARLAKYVAEREEIGR
jgi:hypothetical protein